MPTPRKRELSAENAAFRRELSALRQRLAAEEKAGAVQADHARQLAAVRSLSQEIATELDLQVLLSLIVRRITELVKGGNGTIWLWEDASRSLVLQTPIKHEEQGQRLALGQGVAGVAAQRREGLIVNDYPAWPHVRPEILARTRVTAVVAEPLLYRDRLTGVLSIDNEHTGRVFGPGDQEILRLFAPQAAVAIENARLHTAARRRREELAALLRSSRNVLENLDLRQSLDRIVVEAAQIARTPHVKILLVDTAKGALVMAAQAGEPVPQGFQVPLGQSYSGTVATTGAPLYIADTQNDSDNLLRDRDRSAGIRTYLGLPIARRGQVLGVLTLNTEAPREYDDEDMAYFSSFADHAAIAIENARLYEAARAELADRQRADAALTVRTRELEAIRALSVEITRELDLSRLLVLLIERLGALIGGGVASIHLWDAQAQCLNARVSKAADPWRRQLCMRLGEGVSGTVALRREGLIVNDFRSSTYCTPFHAQHSHHTAVMAEPLVYRDRLLGVITLDNEGTDRRFTEEDQRVLRLFADHAAIAIENARLFDELRQSLTRLEQTQEEMVRSEKLRALGQMSAGIAHDLNNMLATILGQAELLRLRMPDPVIRESLVTLETAATDGAHVVRRLQDFARQRGHPSLAPVDLAVVVAEAVEITRPRWQDEAQRRGVSIRMDVALSAPLPVLGYAPEIREVLTNLIFNAVDAMPNGGTLRMAGHVVESAGSPPLDWSRREAAGSAPPPAQSTLRPIDPSARLVELTVSDTGIGMAEDVRRRVFDPFFTTKGTGGTGLGLSVVYGIMERHGGRVEVDSTQGRGTTFTLRFQSSAAVEAPSKASGAGEVVSVRRLLVIDDEDAVRETLVQLLLTAGHQVLEAPSGAVGLQILEQSPVDCVLTDLGMPEMIGWEVARRVKARRPDLPVVLLTGWGEQVAGGAGPEDGSVVDRILGKPVRLDEILTVIADLTATPRRAPNSNGPA
jgi:signal transduction histidine kinase/ActR/RegA family two-component response regulator